MASFSTRKAVGKAFEIPGNNPVKGRFRKRRKQRDCLIGK